MLRLFVILASFFLLSMQHSFASDNIFLYAGLSTKTTEHNLRERYSTSEFRSNYVKLSDKDSHDYITSVTLTVTDQFKRVRIGFGKELQRISDKSRRFFYPPCQEIYNQLKLHYGKENGLNEFYEESMKSRRFTWKHKNETLVLHCFESDNNFRSEAISIYSK